MITNHLKTGFAIFIFSLVSCQAFDEQEGITTMTVEASSEGTKTVLENEFQVLWSKDDAITVNGNPSLSIQIQESGKKAVFVVPKSESPYCAAYPASAYHLGKLHLPKYQTYRENTFDPSAALMLASSSDNTLQFKTVNSFLKINITGKTDKDDIYKIIVSARGGENLSGPLSIDYNNLSATATLNEGSTVQIQSESGIKQGSPIYISIPAQSYSNGLTFQVIDVNNHLYEASTPENHALTTLAGEITTINCDFVPQESAVLPFEESMLSHLTASNHPRLLITDPVLSDIKTKVAENSVVSKIHNILIRQADYSLKQPILEFLPESQQRNMLALCRSAITQIWSCSYAYRYTKEQRYFDHAVAQIEAVCNFPSWLTELSSLNMAEMCNAVAIGYDWLYPYLTTTQKTNIESAIDSYAFSTTLNGQWSTNFFEAKTNWEPVCCGGLTMAALATYEVLPDHAYKILDKCIASNQKIAPIFYQDNGNSGEGYGYWIFGSSYQVLLNYCLESTIDFDYSWRIPGYDKTAHFFHSLESQNRTVFNYSDASSINVAAGIPLWYFAYKQGDPTILSYELEKLDMTCYTDVKKDGVRLLAMILPWVCNTDFHNIHHPSSNLYYSEGRNCIATGRTTWEHNKGNFFGLKGGFGCKTHGHLDVGSFVFDAQGERWAYDVGNPNYAEIETELKKYGGDFWDMSQNSLRWSVNAMNNFYHNTLTIGDAIHDVKGLAVVTDAVDTQGLTSCTMDLTDVFDEYVKKVSRTVTLTSDDKLSVTDKVTSYSGNTVPLEWRMMTKAKVEILSDCIKLELNGKTEYLKVKSDKAVFEYQIFSNEKQHDYDMDLSMYNIVGFSTNIPSSTVCTFETTLTSSF